MQRVTARGMTLEGNGGKTPPLPFITMDDKEADALRALYPQNIVFLGEADAADPAQQSEGTDEAGDADNADAGGQDDAGTGDAGTGEGASDGAGEDADDLANDEQSGDAGDGAGDGDAETVTEAAGRAAEIAEAIDLLNSDADFVKNGDRAGKPKVKAVEDVLGYEVTAEEIDAVLASRETE